MAPIVQLVVCVSTWVGKMAVGVARAAGLAPDEQPAELALLGVMVVCVKVRVPAGTTLDCFVPSKSFVFLFIFLVFF